MSSPFVSIYEPVKITIDGQEYPVRKRTRSVMRQLAQIQARLEGELTNEEAFDFGYEQIAILVDAPAEVIDGLDVGQARAINRWLGAYLRGKAGGPEEEDPGKNPERPGDENPPA